MHHSGREGSRNRAAGLSARPRRLPDLLGTDTACAVLLAPGPVPLGSSSHMDLFTGEKTEARGGGVACPGSHRHWMQSQRPPTLGTTSFLFSGLDEE